MFRYLIYFVTWLATGHAEFGQDGHVGSSHLPCLGLGFFVVIPAPEAWPIVVGALGTGGPTELGSDVSIELPGGGPLDGVIDYATTNFIGLRTPDALIRLHGRWSLGMTVAVSHHAYRDSFDAEATERAWKAWLDQALTAATVSPIRAPPDRGR